MGNFDSLTPQKVLYHCLSPFESRRRSWAGWLDSTPQPLEMPLEVITFLSVLLTFVLYNLIHSAYGNKTLFSPRSHWAQTSLYLVFRQLSFSSLKQGDAAAKSGGRTSSIFVGQLVKIISLKCSTQVHKTSVKYKSCMRLIKTTMTLTHVTPQTLYLCIQSPLISVLISGPASNSFSIYQAVHLLYYRLYKQERC